MVAALSRHRQLWKIWKWGCKSHSSASPVDAQSYRDESAYPRRSSVDLTRNPPTSPTNADEEKHIPVESYTDTQLQLQFSIPHAEPSRGVFRLAWGFWPPSSNRASSQMLLWLEPLGNQKSSVPPLPGDPKSM